MGLPCGLHWNNEFVCMLHILNMIPTRNSVINADENFLVHHFQRGVQFTIMWECFVQCVQLWAVRGHAEDVQNYVKRL
jgi:hypothetical protein